MSVNPDEMEINRALDDLINKQFNSNTFNFNAISQSKKKNKIMPDLPSENKKKTSIKGMKKVDENNTKTIVKNKLESYKYKK